MLDTTDTRALRREGTRDRILKAAWKLARKEGLASFSLRDLAKAVGMRAPSLYSYFDSKLALYDAMFAQGNRELVERFSAIDVTDFDDYLRQSAKILFEFNLAEPARYQLLFQRTIPGFEPSPESYAIAIDLLAEARRRFSDAGFDDPRVVDLWTAVTSGLFSQQMANDPGGDRWFRLVDEALDMFLKHVANKRKGAKR